MAFDYYDANAPAQFVSVSEHFIVVTRRVLGIELRYDLDSIMKLDSIIDAIGPPRDQKASVDILQQVGSFLGEALRRTYGGRWVWDEGYATWRVHIPTPSGRDTTPGPFAKAQKRIESGMEDSISHFARVTDAMVRGEVPPA